MALGLSRLGNAALLLLAFWERGGCPEFSWIQTSFFMLVLIKTPLRVSSDRLSKARISHSKQQQQQHQN